ncbi:MAG TPA: NAD(P)-binding domain-containing protein [Micromonospora sp.]|nr:NAD(P)-binding domain-containing protein [Micromonospora sp.]
MADVTIIGAGKMARGIATRFFAGGTSLQILAPTAEHAISLANGVGKGAETVMGAGVQEPLSGAVVVLAVPYEAALDFASSRSGELTGKVLVDITNPVDWASFDRLVTPADSSAAEEIAKRAPGARVVKAFNTTFAATVQAGTVAGQQLDVLLAGDDEDAKARVAGLVTAGGLRAIEVGPLRRAHQLEQLGFLHMALQEKLGSNHGSTIKIITP